MSYGHALAATLTDDELMHALADRCDVCLIYVSFCSASSVDGRVYLKGGSVDQLMNGIGLLDTKLTECVEKDSWEYE